ncbi:hypothetical protein LTR53_009361 [Teratosphaeriaceae sp. CCFEE 6253]|nr:hypothetical protein LTR53_009361 [Teratosphaeriaceae sp. CCFEE 6253]
MKSFTTITVIPFATAAVALPSLWSRQDGGCIVNTVDAPGFGDSMNSINAWASNVNNVNSFLNTAAGLDSSTLGHAANLALGNATDEPCQLATLSNFGTAFGLLTDAFTCAVADLKVVFGDHVLTNLETIIADPTNSDAVHAAITDINFFRCCNVLVDADLLWLDSADRAGIADSVPINAGRPDACASVDCSAVTSCRFKDNAQFGK